VRLPKIDLRPQPLEVTAQEILTKDRVGIRVTLTAFSR
jgi:regulator of protease activity HflC (stomatin/prohibitin superfamily)